MIGPSIPEHLLKKKKEDQDASGDHSSGSAEGVIETTIPESTIQSQEFEETHSNVLVEDDDADAYAPALPPDLLEQREIMKEEPAKGRRRAPIGPSLPTASTTVDSDDEFIGPAIPNHRLDDGNEASGIQATIAQIEERAQRHKESNEKPNGDGGKIERAEWMIVPPEVDLMKQAMTGRSRTFSQRTVNKADPNSSGWTHTPSDQEKDRSKEDRGKRKHSDRSPPRTKEKEREIRERIDTYNKSERPEALVRLHKKKKSNKSNEEHDDPSKRRFDREKDLNTSRLLNRKERQEFMKMASDLGSRFGSGRGSFL